MTKTIRTLLIVCISMTYMCAQELSNALKITHLSGDFYIYTTYQEFSGTLFPSNNMYVVTNKGVILIDTPWDPSQFEPLLDSIYARHNKEVVLCISTHFHADRTAGLEYFRSKGIATYTSRNTYDLCRERNEKLAEFYFTNDTTFVIGNYKFETFYPGEGHTSDNIVIWFEKEKILYGGCLVKSVESQGMGNIADANLKQWRSTIENIIEKFPYIHYVIPGHFGGHSDQALVHTLELLKEIGY